MDSRRSFLALCCICTVVLGLGLLFARRISARRSKGLPVEGWRYVVALVGLAVAGYYTWVAVIVFFGALP